MTLTSKGSSFTLGLEKDVKYDPCKTAHCALLLTIEDCMKLKEEANMELEVNCGDFFLRCLPKTFEYYLKQTRNKKHTCEDIDEFDFFIKNEIKAFGFLMNEYYKKNRVEKMKLSAFADPNLLIHFDELIINYLREKSNENYYKIKELYIYMLEKKIVELLK